MQDHLPVCTAVAFAFYRINFYSLRNLYYRWAENVSYSTLFLSSYCTIAWIAFCIWSRTHRNLAVLKLSLLASGTCSLLRSLGFFFSPLSHANLLICTLAGLATLFDHKSRRMELALYCVPKALEAQYSRYVSYGRIPRVPYGEFLLFAVAMASTVYCYQKRTDAIRGTVRSLLGWMWGHC